MPKAKKSVFSAVDLLLGLVAGIGSRKPSWHPRTQRCMHWSYFQDSDSRKQWTSIGSRRKVQLGLLKHAASGRRVWRPGDLPAWMMWRVSSMMLGLGRYQKSTSPPPSQTLVVEENRLDQRAAAALEGAPPMVGTSEPHPRTDEMDPRADIHGKMM